MRAQVCGLLWRLRKVTQNQFNLTGKSTLLITLLYYSVFSYSNTAWLKQQEILAPMFLLWNYIVLYAFRSFHRSYSILCIESHSFYQEIDLKAVCTYNVYQEMTLPALYGSNIILSVKGLGITFHLCELAPRVGTASTPDAWTWHCSFIEGRLERKDGKL